jgi:hypothetical protein
MIDSYETLLEHYLKLPDRLEAAIAGLSESQLDLTLDTGWSIREYVHHTVEGELLWQLNLRAILGRDGIEFPFDWFFGLPQNEWVERWAYGKRDTGPALTLFRGSTATLVELLRNVPPEVWEHYGRVTWPGAEKETRLTICDIVLMHLRHMDQHAVDIQAIRTRHGC